MKDLQFQLLQTGTPAYDEMLTLRMNVLLAPIGIPRSYIDPEKEADDLLIGAYLNGELVGCCILTPRSKDTVQLRQMAVAASLQGKGLGAAILQFAEKLAKEKGFTVLRLHARENVVGFYRKCGYEIVGEPFSEVGIHHRQMQKSL